MQPDPFSLSFSLTAQDPESSVLTFDITAPPQHGILTGAPPGMTYTPDGNYFGPDSFTFIASDGH